MESVTCQCAVTHGATCWARMVFSWVEAVAAWLMTFVQPTCIPSVLWLIRICKRHAGRSVGQLCNLSKDGISRNFCEEPERSAGPDWLFFFRSLRLTTSKSLLVSLSPYFFFVCCSFVFRSLWSGLCVAVLFSPRSDDRATSIPSLQLACSCKVSTALATALTTQYCL